MLLTQGKGGNLASATTSNYLYQKQIDFLLKGTAWVAPTTIYVALFITAPALDGTGGTEVLTTGGTNYARVGIAQGAAWQGPTGVNLEYSNVNSVDFAAPGADWGTIGAAGLYDSASGTTNLLFIANLTTNKVVSNGDGAPKILAAQLRITRATCA